MLLGATAALNTLAILNSIRIQMQMPGRGYQALIVPNNGPHYGAQAECERRIQAISGFTGGSASVIITPDSALLWTDGRYWIQAEQQLDENWTLMKQGAPGIPSEAEWLLGNLAGADIKVGVDATLYPQNAWEKMVAVFDGKIELLDTQDNLVDLALAEQNSQLPPCLALPITQLEVDFAGKTVIEKLNEVRVKMTAEGADLLLVTELDEIAWLFNLRGTDMPPMFYAYALVTRTGATLIVNSLDAEIETDLGTAGVTVEKSYHNPDTIITDHMGEVTNVWISKYANHHMVDLARDREPKPIIKLSPIALLKAIKNNIEVEGMKRAHLRDSAAIVTFLSWLEKRIVSDGVTDISEISAAEELLRIRELARSDPTANFVGQSFKTISGFGPNAAIIHYRPTAETNAFITKDGIYLVDSGGQYKDGTTDITRSVHLGNPRDDHRDRFTRVLKGHIAVATSVFPNKLTGNRLESFARKSLWDAKLDYEHGSGHGIGMYMNVHEGPHNMGSTLAPDDSGLEENMFMSNEPGYYKENDYGIRIENIVRVATADDGFLKFETVSFVPLQLKLIDLEMLSAEEVQWVDNYHINCRDKVGGFIRNAAYFEEESKQASLDWLQSATMTLGEFNSGGTKILFSSVTLLGFLVIQHLLPKFML